MNWLITLSLASSGPSSTSEGDGWNSWPHSVHSAFSGIEANQLFSSSCRVAIELKNSPPSYYDLLTAVLNGHESLNESLLQWSYSSIVHAPGARITVQGNLLCGYRTRHVYTAKKQIRHGGSWRIFDALESDYRYQFAVTCRCASGIETSNSPLPLKHESLSLAESEILQHRLCRLP